MACFQRGLPDDPDPVLRVRLVAEMHLVVLMCSLGPDVDPLRVPPLHGHGNGEWGKAVRNLFAFSNFAVSVRRWFPVDVK